MTLDQLHTWDKNEASRLITADNFSKLKADIQRNGIEEALIVGPDGTVYNGNHRLKALLELAKENITTANNGKALNDVPVVVKEINSEADKWRAALVGNSQYAQWSEGLSNFLPEFENDVDVALINVNFGTPLSIENQLDVSSDDDKSGDPKQKKLKELQCPNCGHSFTI